MANTYTTNKARQARIAQRKGIAAINGIEPEKLNQVRSELATLAVDGRRYGNHRKMKAAEKVTGRRTERKALNRLAADL